MNSKTIIPKRINPQQTDDNKSPDNQPNTPLPSELNCGECLRNQHNDYCKKKKAILKLGSEELIIFLKDQLYHLRVIPIDLIKDYIAILKKRLAAEEQKLALSKNTVTSIPSLQSPDEPQKEHECIIFHEKKCDFIRNAAHYYFNPKNLSGLHLSKKQIVSVANMLFENYKSVDGSRLKLRALKEGLKNGFLMNEKGEIIEN